MKKTIGLFILVLFIIGSLFLVENHEKRIALTDGDKTPISIHLPYEMGWLTVHPWHDEETGIWYVFFPSYIDTRVIDCSGLKQGTLYVNGERAKHLFEWQDQTLYELKYQEQTMQVMFMEDQNLSSLFLETKSGSDDWIRASKENMEGGYLLALNAQGNVEHSGSVQAISGHGNGWELYEKKAYSLKLTDRATLGGIGDNKDWKLLHLWNDGDKIHSKLAFDIAEILGAKYTPECTWVNVYLNGEYQGMYLLTTALKDQDVFKEKGSFLLERDFEDRYLQDEHLITQGGNGFVIHRPKEITAEEKLEIIGMIQAVENAIEEGEIESSLLDMDSFVIQLLLNEITLNFDAFTTSTYVYKTAVEDRLYAGPAWDYDGAFGEYVGVGSWWANPNESVFVNYTSQLTWYYKLYENPIFLEAVMEKYKSVMPQLQKLYEQNIDLYAEYIQSSIRNDEVRWKGGDEVNGKAGSYLSWDNNVRYLEYFCLARYNALKARWGGEGEDLVFRETGEQHKVRIIYDGKETVIQVTDGEILHRDVVKGVCQIENGIVTNAYSEEEHSSYLPVLEDMVLKVEGVVSVTETETHKCIDIPRNLFSEDYKYVSIFVIDSEGNIEDVQIAKPLGQNTHLEFDKDASGMVAIYALGDEIGTVILDDVLFEY